MRENCPNNPFIRKGLTKARIIISNRDKKEVLQIMYKMDLFVE